MKQRAHWVLGFLLVLPAAAPASAQAVSDTIQQDQEVGRDEYNGEMVVPPGTVIPIVISSFLNTKSSQVGDTFYSDTAYPVWIQQRLVIPKGSTIRGTVTEVVRPGRIKGKGRLAVRIDDILLPNGVQRTLVASFRGIHGPGDEKLDRKTETIEGGSTKGTDAGQILAPSSQGAVIGAVTDNGAKGAVIGAGAGAAVGLATVMLSRGRDLVLEPGTQFDLELKQPIRFSLSELGFSNAELNNARSPAARPRSQTQRSPNLNQGRIWPF